MQVTLRRLQEIEILYEFAMHMTTMLFSLHKRCEVELKLLLKVVLFDVHAGI